VPFVLRRLWEQREQGRATNGALLHALTLAPPSELEGLVSGLPVQALFHAGADRMMASVRGIVGTHLAPYSHLPQDAGAQSWSIRRYVREGKGWLWLPYAEKQSAALRPLLAAWLGEAVNAMLSLPPDLSRRYWLLLDEVGSIGCVQGLIDALTKGRKYGLCAVLGLQSIAQLRAAFGDDGAQTLLSCVSSQLILRVNDPETAEYASSHLGECEVMRESVTRARQGDTRTKQYHVKRLVLPSEIQGLKNRRGYLHFAEQNRVRRVKIALFKRKPIIAAFEPREPTQHKPLPSLPAPPAAAAAPAQSPSSPPVRRPALDADAILGSFRQ
jgi:type IV secretory pathway TraG/TraD family ATPase VirD4